MTSYELMPGTSRVWIYQSNLPFTDEEVPEIKEQVKNFATNWVSHNNALRSYGDVLNNRFIILMVDESQAGASGCSIDKSVHFIKAMGHNHGVDFFDRMNFAFKIGEELKTAHRDAFAQLFQDGAINDSTLVFNNLGNIQTGSVPPFLFNLAGITAWNYFKVCLTGTSNTFRSNASLFGKVYFPRVIMP